MIGCLARSKHFVWDKTLLSFSNRANLLKWSCVNYKPGKSGSKAGSLTTFPFVTVCWDAGVFSIFFFYTEVEIGVKLHNILAAIFLSQLHSHKSTAILKMLCFGCSNLMAPNLAFKATGGCYFWPVQEGEESVVAHSVCSFVGHMKSGYCVLYTAAGVLYFFGFSHGWSAVLFAKPGKTQKLLSVLPSSAAC